MDYDAQKVEYCPAWKWNREEKKRELLKIQVRRTGSDHFLDIHNVHLRSTGLHLTEMLEYLDKSDATKVSVGSI
tara:strand:+ start:321 stop:542 length:222 start_codon:yes stop_codon:yes gene_type:complete